jgi:hypothetical protein
LYTDIPEIAENQMCVLIAKDIAAGLVTADSQVARVYGPSGVVNLRPDRPHQIDASLSELNRLAALSELEYGVQRKVAAKRLGVSSNKLDELTGHEPRPVNARGVAKTRRYLLRKQGYRTPMAGPAWHYCRPGKKYFCGKPGGVKRVRITFAKRTYEWELPTRDNDAATAIMEPVRLARQQVYEAAAKVLDSAIGTAAHAAAVAARDKACFALAVAIEAVGGPMDLVKFVQGGTAPPRAAPAETGRPLTTTERIAMKKAAEEELLKWLIEKSQAHPERKQPELFKEAQQIWGKGILTREIWRRIVPKTGIERLKIGGRPLG